jgi:hypothetical protein
MLYAILCYDSEADVGSWTREQDAAAITKLDVVQDGLAREKRLGRTRRPAHADDCGDNASQGQGNGSLS